VDKYNNYENNDESINKDKLINKHYGRDKLFKKAINLMADEKLDEAAVFFEKALILDPDNIDILLKLGYMKFHLNDYNDAIKVYDKILDIDITNAEAWNLKSLIYYRQKNYIKALNCVDKAVESNPTYDMAWYNKACFHSILNQIPESIESLKRSVEINVKNAKKAVNDKDFTNIKIDDGFKRIIDVVVLESIKQGYHTIGPIVWTTFISKVDVEHSLQKLLDKGFIIKKEKRQGLHKIPSYDLVPEMAKNLNKKNIFTKAKPTLASNKLKYMNSSIQELKSSIEKENVENTILGFESLIDSEKYGKQMIEHFFEEHREIRLWRIRLKDNGARYLHDNKNKILDLLNNIEIILDKKLNVNNDFYSADRSQ